MAGGVFISYRWGPSSSDAVGRLTSALQQRLKTATVTMDVQSRLTGVERLRERIQNELKAADVIVIAIHPDWIEAMPRLHQPDDLVRLEIEAAFEFGLKVIPVLLNGARMPEEEELPDALKVLADQPTVAIGVHETYEASLDRLARDIKASLPSRTLRALTWLANSTPINVAFALALLGAFMLFVSHGLGIHTLFLVNAEVKARLGTDTDVLMRLTREVGLLMAWNWTAVLMIITPVMFQLFANTLRQAKQLLDVLQHRKMMYYVVDASRTTPLTARRLWEAVTRPSAIWCQAFAALAVVLSIYQWWIYSGEWAFKTYTRDDFLNMSTGLDWNVAWLPIITPPHASEMWILVVFALLMYLVYGIGTAVTFSYYAFLFNFFAELSQLATSAGVRSGTVLRLDVSDRDSGGLAAFRVIQRDHAAFCLWTLFAMYLMALRNAYLPPVCRIPAGVATMLGDQATQLAQCSHMAAFTSTIYYSAVHFGRTLLAGRPDFGIFFHTYSEQNPFVLGSALYVCLIASFFVLISSRMTSIVETARHRADPELADNLLKRIRFENRRVVAIMAIGALSIVFLNFGVLVILAALVLFPLEYLWSRQSSASRRQAARTA